jgi:DNA-binding CsgD family transcriptional regulator
VTPRPRHTHVIHNGVMPKLDVLVDAVDRSYDAGLSDPDWLRQLLETIAPELDGGCGLAAWFYDASDFSNLRLFHPTSLDTRDGTLEAVFASASHPETPPEVLAEHWATPAGALTALLGDAADDFTPWRDTFYRIGVRDIVTINAYDTDGRGMAVNAFHPQRLELSRAYVEQLERVAAHLISAYRLRRAGAAHVEAIMTPAGRVEHAEGEALAKLDELCEAAQSIERARGAMRKDAPEEALAAWRALIDARWSLVDFVDRDGKRFLVARVNEPSVAAGTRLSTRERQIVALVARGHSNKLIGYDLGIAEGTVAAHLSSAMRKLDVSNRANLAAVFTSAAADA